MESAVENVDKMESAGKEIGETEEEAPDELLRHTAAQEDVNRLQAGLLGQPPQVVASGNLRVRATEADLGNLIDPDAAATIKQDHVDDCV